jgi:hypothetical protein
MDEETPPLSRAYRAIQAGLDAWEMWEGMAPPERLALILDQFPAESWYAHDPHTEDNLHTLTFFRDDPSEWGRIKQRFKDIGGNPWDLEKAADAYMTLHPNGIAPLAPAPMVTHYTPLAPVLPRAARLSPLLSDEAAPWLDAYITHSRGWSPRAAPAFHSAVGLWMLSTIAARRIRIEMGTAIYPTLFIAMVARSTLYAKTTTAKIGIDALRQAGCGHLLAADRSTPQALLRSMAGYLPPDYGSRSPEAQEALQHRVAFAAQRGWYFEEWGGLLHQMTRKDSPMADFHGLLRVLDDGYETFESETIHRGMDHVDNPYLSLLASATPHDLSKFLTPGAPWWHDGFWPRIALIVPLPEDLPSLGRRPLGTAQLPASLIEPLQAWYRRLGVPSVTIEAAVNATGKPTGEWRAERSPLPCQTLEIAPDVKDAYDTYNEALLQLIINGDAPSDLEACYGRLHDKAIRIAMLLASFAGQSRLTLPYWAYAQNIAEEWRVMLHQTIAMASEGQPLGREEQLEQKLESQLARHGLLTARDLHRHLKGFSSREINLTLQAMIQAGRVVEEETARTKKYTLPLGGGKTAAETLADEPF